MKNTLAKLFACALLTTFITPAKAQVVKWLINPQYDEITIMYNGMYKVKKDGKSGIINQQGKEILPIKYDSITQYKDGYALLYENGYSALTGYVDETGSVTNLKDKGYRITSGYPYFSNGQLLVMSKDNRCYFVNSANGEAKGPFAEAMPFFDGYASVAKYEDPLKPNSDIYHTIITSEKCEEMTFPKDMDKSDINFISSISGKKALVIMKKKAYELNCDYCSYSPIYADSTKNKNSIITALDKNVLLTKDGEGMNVLQTKNACLTFDVFNRLSTIRLHSDTISYKLQNIQPPVFRSPISPFRGTDTYGLQYNGSTILPPQLQSVGIRNGNAVIVRLEGKDGVLLVEPESKFAFRINDNNDIGFRHDKYESMLVMTMPSQIDSKTARVESLTEGCVLKLETRKNVSNAEISSVSYNCDLNIPANISETVKTFPYKFKVRYDGLESIDYEVNVGAWYVKNLQVDMSSLQQSRNMKDTTITVTFNIKEDVTGGNYYRDVKVVTDDDECPVISLDKISETSYKAIIRGTDEGPVTCSILIQERRCPVITQSFDLALLDYPKKVSQKPKKVKAKPKPKVKDVTQPSLGF